MTFAAISELLHARQAQSGSTSLIVAYCVSSGGYVPTNPEPVYFVSLLDVWQSLLRSVLCPVYRHHVYGMRSAGA